MVEKIKTEYMLFEPVDMPESLDEVREYISKYIDEMNDTCLSAEKSIRDNYFDEKITHFKNMFFRMFGYEEDDEEWFNDDSEILLRHGRLADIFNCFFINMRNVLTEDNFVQVYGFAQFTYNYYVENYNYLESLRDRVMYRAMKGINYYGVGEDTQVDFCEFFSEEFENIRNVGLQKKK